MDVKTLAHQLVEPNIRHVSFPEQMDILAGLASTGRIVNLPYRTPEHRFAYQQALAKIEPRLTTEIVQAAAKRLMLELVQREVDRQVAKEAVRWVYLGHAGNIPVPHDDATTKLNLYTQYCFYPVGQGLFASGFIAQSRRSGSPFRWVYDCGTSSKQSNLRKAICSLEQDLRLESEEGKQHIDLVTISHFDRDHISGLTELLSQFSVDTLLLPYMSLEERLVLAFEQNIDSQQSLIRFFVNPVEYIVGNTGAQIRQIVFVPGSGGQSAPDDEGEIAPPTLDGPWALNVPVADPDAGDESEDLKVMGVSGNTKRVAVHMLKPASTLTLAGFWEFVPYNDSNPKGRLPKALRNQINRGRQQLLSGSSDEIRRSALAGIRASYDRHFGRTALQRNVISLFLYSGLPRVKMDRIYIESFTGSRHRLWRLWRADQQVANGTPRSSVLYTGDGYLNTKARIDRMTRFLRPRRVGQLSCLQVMHHGAVGNWHSGLAAALSPDVSVFSSDPDHRGLGHPHAAVLRDFWPYGPIQVDTRHGYKQHTRFVWV